jgi:Na+/melibiose symporter-like transporter
MKLSPAALIDHARSEEGRKKIRYAGVSVVFVPLGQGLIQIFGLFMTFTTASLVTAAILTLPNFFANKLYVWRVTSKENQRTQIAIFWVAAMLGVTFATSLTWGVEQLTADQGEIVKRLAVFVAQLTGFGIVWVGRFLVLDRWLFRLTHHGREPSPVEEHELHADVPI